MLTSVEGVYRNGHIELLEPPQERENARVIVTFLPLREQESASAPPLSPAQAADLRARLRSFAPDWERPDMDIYDTL